MIGKPFRVVEEMLLLPFLLHLFDLVIIIAPFESSPINGEGELEYLKGARESNWLTMLSFLFFSHRHHRQQHLSMCVPEAFFSSSDVQHFSKLQYQKGRNVIFFLSLTRATLWRHICHLHVVASYSPLDGIHDHDHHQTAATKDIHTHRH